MAVRRRKHYLSVPLFPKFEITGSAEDGLVPVTRVTSWKGADKVFERLGNSDLKTEWIFRGQRRYDWGLVPSLGRLSETGTFDDETAKRQLDAFKLSIRGRVTRPELLDEDDEVWALGQHHGLKTHLLDWTYSPYVALFFAFVQSDPAIEKPRNYSRSIFALNKGLISQFNPDLFLDPMRYDHSRLISQAGLFTRSPAGEQTLVTELINSIAEQDVDVDDPQTLSQYLCKIHVPCDTEGVRLDCMRALRKMNVHHASLFPDLIGSSDHCNLRLIESANSETRKASRTGRQEREIDG